MEKQLTVVEWLESEMPKLVYIAKSNKVKFDELINQAKEMDKEEKIDFADKYGTYLLQGGIMSAAAYNETFKSE